MKLPGCKTAVNSGINLAGCLKRRRSKFAQETSLLKNGILLICMTQIPQQDSQIIETVFLFALKWLIMSLCIVPFLGSTNSLQKQRAKCLEKAKCSQ